MNIPDYQTIMLPLLQLLNDGKLWSKYQLVNSLAIHFNLTSEQLSIYLPSGNQLMFNSRVGWSTTYLKKACLINSPKRAHLEITQRGKDFLATNPTVLNNEILKQYSEFMTFLNYAKIMQQEQLDNFENYVQITHPENLSPEERVELEIKKMKDSLSLELIQTVRNLTPSQFENLVLKLLNKMGYGGLFSDSVKHTGQTNDGGIDGIIYEDKLGLDKVYIQAKCWGEKNWVGRPEVQKFVGALAGKGAKKGVFITTSYFSKEAEEFTPMYDINIVKINGFKLAELLIEYNVGVAPSKVYEVKKLDIDFLTDELG